VLVPSSALEPCRTVQSIPFSACRLPLGTTRPELVTSGRSVAIGSALVGYSSANDADEEDMEAIARASTALILNEQK